MDLGDLSLILSVGIAVAAVLVAGGAWQMSRRRRRQVADRALSPGSFALLADPEVGFEGLKAGRGGRSRWRRGKGVLVLMERQLRYDEFLPSWRFEVPLKRIRAADTTSSFLGKDRGKKVLILHFTDANGVPADVGFSMADPDRWAIQIRKRLPT